MNELISFQEVIARLKSLTEHQSEMKPYAKAVALWQGLDHWPCPSELNQILGLFVNGAAAIDSVCELRFVEQAPKPRVSKFKKENAQNILSSGLLPSGRAAQYVHSIAVCGTIPTRLANLHDFANALTWAVFPQAKRTVFRFLHEDYLDFYQSNLVLEKNPSGGGGRGRGLKADRLTVLDESGVLALQKDEHLEPIVFGHGLIEQLVLGGPTVHAPTWTLPVVRCPAELSAGSSQIMNANLDHAAASYFSGLFLSSNHRPDQKTTAVTCIGST